MSGTYKTLAKLQFLHHHHKFLLLCQGHDEQNRGRGATQGLGIVGGNMLLGPDCLWLAERHAGCLPSWAVSSACDLGLQKWATLYCFHPTACSKGRGRGRALVWAGVGVSGRPVCCVNCVNKLI